MKFYTWISLQMTVEQNQNHVRVENLYHLRQNSTV